MRAIPRHRHRTRDRLVGLRGRRGVWGGR